MTDPNDDLSGEHIRRDLLADGTADRVRRLLLAHRDGTPIDPIFREAEQAGLMRELAAVLTGLLQGRLTDADYTLLTNMAAADLDALLNAQPDERS